MPNFVDGTRLVRGVNPSKSLRRFVAGVRMRVKNDKDEYILLPQRKERVVFNQKHIGQAGGAYEDFIASRNEGQTPVSFSSCLPDDYKDCPAEVKYGYYLHPEITELIVNGSAGEFVSMAAEAAEAARAEAAKKGRGIDEAELPTAEDYPKQALHNFRSLLRGEKFDVASAILGAKMILKWDWDNNNKLPAELHNLAYRLWSAKDRISEGSNFPSTVGFVFGTVVHTNALEVGDVHVRTPVAGKIAFRTKAINNNKTRFGFLKKKARSAGATESKLSAAYQSLFHAARLAKKNNDKTPFFLEVWPLYGSTNDGSEASMEEAAKITLMEAVRFVTIYPNVKIKFGGGNKSHKAFRKIFGRQLSAIFSYEIGKPVKTAIKLKENTSVLTHARGSRASRPLADLNATLTTGSSSNPDSSDSFSEDEGALSDSQAERKATSETGSSSSNGTDFSRREGSKFDREKPIEEGKRLVNAGREAEESEESSKSDDAFGSSIECAEVTDVVTPDKQESKSASLDIGASYSGADSDSSSYSGQDRAYRTPRLPSSDGGGQATLGGGSSNSKENGSTRVDPAHYKNSEIKLPPLSLSSDSESIYAEENVKKLVEKANKSKKPSQINEELNPGRKAGIRTILARVVKAVRGFSQAKPLPTSEEVGKKVIFGRDGVQVSPVRSNAPLTVSQLALNGRLPEDGRQPQGAESEVSENAAHGSLGKSGLLDFEEIADRLVKKLDPLHDYWVDPSMGSINIPRLTSDIVLFDRVLNDFLSNIRRPEGFPPERQAAIKGAVIDIEGIKKELEELRGSLTRISPGNNTRVREAIGFFVRLMAKITNPSGAEATVQGQRRSVENDGKSIGNSKDVKERRRANASVNEAEIHSFSSRSEAAHEVESSSQEKATAKKSLEVQKIRGQLKIAVEPLRELYLTDLEPINISRDQLSDDIKALASSIEYILAGIFDIKFYSPEGRNKRIIKMKNVLRDCEEILQGIQGRLEKATFEDQRKEVEEVLRKVVEVMDIMSRSTGKEVGSDRSRAEMIETEASEAAFSLQNYWRTSRSIEKGRFEQGLVDILNISAGAKDKAGLTELEKNHARLLSVYLAIEKIKDGKDQDGLVQLYQEAMSVVENMLRSSPMHQ
ncbi:hypothetical protein [Rhizobacter sp. OV335]|uniref:hypothetical protein n=1 Tax=Rhizobacter sp. OV335 TaxID=1500264 RepID=UPI00092344E7|nr:hypothetical protein [Rhizobacter sp. OV335]SHN21998.1 hypothetical protein SAMN02787076_04173 [Rhizobacter sp. OV335]